MLFEKKYKIICHVGYFSNLLGIFFRVGIPNKGETVFIEKA